MTEPIQIDARGKKCPRPIIELAKARRRLEPGTVIEIQADDLAFEVDLRAWCETTGNELSALERDGQLVRAQVTLAK